MSADDWDVFRDMRAEKQAKRGARLAAADTTGWSRFCVTHFYRDVDGHRLEWWPSGNKWLYKGKYYRGGLPKWIKDKIHD